MLSFRYRLFPLGFFTTLFNPDLLIETLREGCRNGYRIVRREFSIERRRVLFFFPALAFGILFRRDEKAPDVEHDYRVALYKTRFFTRTVDPEALAAILNAAASDGYELYMGIKYPTRFLGIFPRESYTFIFRKPFAGTVRQFAYKVFQSPYRFFTRTLDPVAYEQDLQRIGQEGQLKITFRDERRLLGIFRQPTVVGIAETPAEASKALAA
jgi:hypothetical protein